MSDKIRVLNISKKFRHSRKRELTTLSDINLEISEGDFVVILGRSGCGKSTLLNIIAGTTSSTSGKVLIDDIEVTGPHPSRSLLFQQPSLLPWLNVEENISFGCKLRGETENLEHRVKQYISMINLTGYERYLPSELSVGMSQRVCLARALIGNPDILLMDEPFGALDTFTRSSLQDELVSIWKRKGFTVIFVTHDIDEAILLGKKVVLIGNTPGTVLDVFDVDLPYPKNIMDDSFLQLKTTIMDSFKESVS